MKPAIVIIGIAVGVCVAWALTVSAYLLRYGDT